MILNFDRGYRNYKILDGENFNLKNLWAFLFTMLRRCYTLKLDLKINRAYNLAMNRTGQEPIDGDKW